MKILYIDRTYLSNGTPGVCRLPDGSELVVTIEPSKYHPEHPCIPEGTVIFKRFRSEKHGEVFRAVYVANRTGIEWHICRGHDGRFLDYTRAGFLEGCISPGEKACEMFGEPAVCGTISAFARFMAYLKDEDEFTLIIRQAEVQQSDNQTQQEVIPVEKKDLVSNHNLVGAASTTAALYQIYNLFQSSVPGQAVSVTLTNHDLSLIGIGIAIGMAAYGFYNGQISRDDIGSIFGFGKKYLSK